jgi:hypothetical protein
MDFERAAHVPFEMVGEHAQQHVSTHALWAAVMDRPDLEVDGLEAAEGALDGCEIFVGSDGRTGIERFGIEVGVLAAVPGGVYLTRRPAIARRRRSGARQ